MYVVRDFRLKFPLNDEGVQDPPHIAEHKYLEKALHPAGASSAGLATRAALNKLFPAARRKLLVVPDPLQDAEKLEKTSFKDTRPEFQDGINRVVDHVLSRAVDKEIYNQKVDGGCASNLADM
jgi:hypothetical protein